MLKHVLNKYLNTTRSSTSHTPKEAHKDTNTDVNTNLQLKQVSKRRCPNISTNGYVKYIQKVTVGMLQEKNIIQDGVKQNMKLPRKVHIIWIIHFIN